MPTPCLTRASAARASGRAVALALALTLAGGTACSGPAQSFGRSPGEARANADGLFNGLGRRFGPLERAENLRAVRPRLLKHFLAPSAIHRDDELWSSSHDSSRTLAVQGSLVGGTYVLAKRPDVSAPAYPGASRHVMRLTRLDKDVYEWDAVDQLAIGNLGAHELFEVLSRALAAIEARDPATLRAGLPLVLGRSTAALGRLFSIDSLDSTPLPDGSASLALVVGMHPDRIRDESKHLAEYLDEYISGARYDVVVEDSLGVPWLTARAERERLAVRWRTLDGRLRPLDGSGRTAPGTFAIRISASMKVFLFSVGVSDLEGELRVIDRPHERGWEIRFRDEPNWQLPLASEHLLGGPLERPFEGEGALLRYVARDFPDAQTVLQRDIRIRVQESTALRLLNRIGNKMASDFEGRAEAELLRFTSEAIAALHRDVVAYLPEAPRIRAETGGR